MTSDNELIKGLQAGSLDALGILYDRHHRLVYRTAVGITLDPEAAADLLQDVFLRLHRFADHVDPNRPLEPWLYRVTANLSYSWVKRNNRWMRPIEDVAEWLINGRRHRLYQEEMDEDWHVIRQAISALPVQQRMVVVLYYINGLSIHEIAEILDVPVGTIKSRLHYGRETLKKRLGLTASDRFPDLQCDFT